MLSTSRDYARITQGPGKTYEILVNTYKPFACGIVIHPTIDACLQLRREHQLAADQIARVDLRVHPLVLELTGKKTPRTGLESKFSVYFAAALAIVRGSAGVDDFSDDNARAPLIVALRDRVTATVDPAIAEHQVRARVTMKDGRTFDKFVEHVIGSVERPMSDQDLEAKFMGLTTRVLSKDRSRELMDMCWRVDTLADVRQLAEAAVAR